MVGTKSLNALFKSHTIFQIRGFFCYLNKAVSCVVRRNSGGRVVALRGGLSLTGGAELQDYWWECASLRPSLEGSEMRHSSREAVRDR